MCKKDVLIVILICYHALSYSQDIGLLKYSSMGISDSLKKEANVVIRLDEGILEIQSPSRYTLKEHQIITVLNKQGADRLHHTFVFDKFRKVEDVEIRVLNELGLEVKKYKKRDFEVHSAYDGISLVTDDKIMKLFTPAPGYPCTVEIKSETVVTSYLELPNWYMNTNKESTELFRYIVKVPTELDITVSLQEFKSQPFDRDKWQSKDLYLGIKKYTGQTVGIE